MKKLLAALSIVAALAPAACDDSKPNVRPIDREPYRGSMPIGAVEAARKTEAVTAIGSLRTALKVAYGIHYGRDAGKLAAAVGGTLNDAKLAKLKIGTLDSNYYKTSDYRITHMGSGLFKITAGKPGTAGYVEKEIQLR